MTWFWSSMCQELSVSKSLFTLIMTSSGDWSGNLFDFFFRVNSKIAKDIKNLLSLKESQELMIYRFIRLFERLWSIVWLIQTISCLVE